MKTNQPQTEPCSNINCRSRRGTKTRVLSITHTTKRGAFQSIWYPHSRHQLRLVRMSTGLCNCWLKLLSVGNDEGLARQRSCDLGSEWWNREGFHFLSQYGNRTQAILSANGFGWSWRDRHSLQKNKKSYKRPETASKLSFRLCLRQRNRLFLRSPTSYRAITHCFSIHRQTKSKWTMMAKKQPSHCIIDNTATIDATLRKQRRWQGV